MSYDIWLEVDLGGEEPARIDDLDWNYTSNCAPMWRKAMPDTDGLAGMHGMPAGQAAEHLRNGIAAMEADPAAFRVLNPENKWGDFDGQLEQLKELLAACARNPKAVLAVWR